MGFNSNWIETLTRLTVAFARMSLREREILEATALDTFWPVYSSREEATEAVNA